MPQRTWSSDGGPSTRTLRIATGIVATGLVLGVGFGLGRVTAASSSAPAAHPPTSSSPSVAPDVPSWAIGATRMNAGVPVGYARTSDGALDAARNYELAFATPLTVNPDAYRAAKAAIATAAWREKDAPDVERTLAGVAPLITAAHQGHATRAVPFILSAQLGPHTADSAEVTVWGGLVVASDNVLAPHLRLAEVTYDLQWVGDWKVAGTTGSDGPGVTSSTVGAQTNALPAELGKNFEGIGDVAGT
jgi:hypothetical protein